MAVYLWLGLKQSKCLSRSSASSEAVGNMEVNVFFLGMLVLEMMFAASGDYMDSISFWVGLPIN